MFFQRKTKESTVSKKSISRELIIWISVTIIGTLLFFLFFFYQYLTSVYLEDIDKKVQQVSGQIYKVFQEPLWNTNIEHIEDIANIYLSSDFIIGMRVNIDSELVFDDYKDNISDYIYKTKIIRSKDIEVGKIEIQFSKESLKMAQLMILKAMIVVIILIIITLLLVIDLLTNKILLTPLRLFTNRITLIAEGDYESTVGQTNLIELDSLGDEVNLMVQKISTREVELRSLKNYMRDIIDSMPSIIIGIDLGFKITQWNKMAEIFTGISSENAKGRSLLTISEEINNFSEKISFAMLSSQLQFISKYKIVKSESTKYYNVVIYPLLSEGLSGAVIRLDDVTELEKKEHQLLQSQKMETMGVLAGGIAHDFNNLLGGIIGTLSVMNYKLDHNSEISKNQLRDYIKTMVGSGDRATDIVKKLLTLSRKSETNFNNIDLNTVIENVLVILKNSIDKSIDLKYERFQEPAIITGNESMIEQVLLNFCVNAAHSMTFMRGDEETWGGNLELNISKFIPDKLFIQVNPASHDKNYWLVSVKDTGVGMSEETLSEIFTPFFTKKDKGKGTGLGLSMVFNIVKDHNGIIDVTSKESIGSTFNLYLPISDNANIGKENSLSEKLPKGEGLILVVDDEEVMRMAAGEILKACGYDVLFAKNGKEALEIFKTHSEKIKLVLLDMVMPEMSGKETYIEIAKIRSDIPVILVSGYNRDGRVQEILDLGVIEYLPKPYTLEKVAEIIHRIVNS